MNNLRHAKPCPTWPLQNWVVLFLVAVWLPSVAAAVEGRQADVTIFVGGGGTMQTTPSSTSSNATATASTASPQPTLGTRATLGLPPAGMQRNGIYFGLLPDWNFYGPSDVARVFGAPVSIIGDYITISNADYSLSQIHYHLPSLKQYASNTVYAPAIIPADGVGNANFTQDMANALASSFATLNNAGITVWCRFAYEFNGYWNNYGQQPDLFKQSWQLLYNATKQIGASKTYFLWSPNVWTGDINDPVNGYTNYYPGDNMVDLAGLSFYFFGDSSQTENILPSSNTFSSAFQSFYDEYHTGHNKPVVISESSAPFHYDQPPGFVSTGNDTEIAEKYQNSSGLTPASGGASELQMKQNWLEELNGATTATQFTGLVAVSWFNLFKDRNNQLMDFRAIYGDNATETYFRTTLGTSSGEPSGGLPSSAPRSISTGSWALLIALATGTYILFNT